MPNKKKSGPGRPPKKFIPKPKAKRSGPGRPKKQEKSYVLPSGKKRNFGGFITNNILHAPKKDNIILLLFVFSLLIFLFSIYVTLLKRQRVLQEEIKAQEPTVENIQTGNIPFVTPEEVTGTTAVQVKIDTSNVIPAFYDAFNQRDITTLYALTDKRLNSTDLFATYFTSNRITKFLGGVEGGVKVSNIQTRDLPTQTTEVQEITYTISYMLKDGQQFSENRSALLIKKGDLFKIGKLMCETSGCSKMPFFNPGKYGIK